MRVAFTLAPAWGAPVVVALAVASSLLGACAAGAPSTAPTTAAPAAPAVPAAPAARGLSGAARRAHSRCVQGEAKACAALGLGLQEGRGLPHDEPLAARYFRRACALAGDPATPACADLGALLLEGAGVAHDRARARALFKAGCDAGYGRACTALGYMEADPRTAAPRLQRGCELGSGWGCYLWAKHREAAAGEAPTAPRVLADILVTYATGCANHYPASCVGAGRLGLAMAQVKQPGAPSARECARWLLKGCQGGEAQGCARLGRLLQRGAPGVPANPGQAAKLLKAACGAGESSACGDPP